MDGETPEKPTNAGKVAPDSSFFPDPAQGAAAASSSAGATVVGYPVIGIHPGGLGATPLPPAGEPDRPMTPLCFIGNCIMSVDLMFWAMDSLVVFLAFHIEMNHGLIGYLAYPLAAAAAFGCYYAVKEEPIPRGCGCLPTCANPQATGCESCPFVPWWLAVVGVLNVVSYLLVLLREIGAEAGKYDYEWHLVIAGLLFRSLEVALGFWWLNRYSKRYSTCCCNHHQFAPRPAYPSQQVGFGN